MWSEDVRWGKKKVRRFGVGEGVVRKEWMTGVNVGRKKRSRGRGKQRDINATRRQLYILKVR
jgi:hypothetical protein